MTVSFTTNLHLELTDFNISPWHDAMHDNFRIIDAAMNQLTGIAGVMGIWKNSTAYVVGNKLFDSDGTLWICAVNHTSSAAPTTFAQHRAANPTHWNPTTAQSSPVLDAIAGLALSADKLILFTGAASAVAQPISVDGKNFINATIAGMRTQLSLATVAVSGAYADLSGKPVLALVATSGAYADLSGKPVLATVATSGAYADLTGKPTLAAVSASGSYADLIDEPSVVTVQIFTASGTWTKPAGCKRVVVEAVGGGGGSGGVDGQGAGTGGTSGGGGGGFYGKTGYVNVEAIASGAVTIGAGGTAGLSTPTDGGDGGFSRIVLGATTYTWGGGLGTPSYVAHAGLGFPKGGDGGTGTNVVGGAQHGGMGLTDNNAGAGGATSGMGGGSPLGTGGPSTRTVVAGTFAGSPGTGFGAGGSGGISFDSATNVAGQAGSGGYMRVWEFY